MPSSSFSARGLCFRRTQLKERRSVGTRRHFSSTSTPFRGTRSKSRLSASLQLSKKTEITDQAGQPGTGPCSTRTRDLVPYLPASQRPKDASIGTSFQKTAMQIQSTASIAGFKRSPASQPSAPPSVGTSAEQPETQRHQLDTDRLPEKACRAAKGPG